MGVDKELVRVIKEIINKYGKETLKEKRFLFLLSDLYNFNKDESYKKCLKKYFEKRHLFNLAIITDRTKIIVYIKSVLEQEKISNKDELIRNLNGLISVPLALGYLPYSDYDAIWENYCEKGIYSGKEKPNPNWGNKESNYYKTFTNKIQNKNTGAPSNPRSVTKSNLDLDIKVGLIMGIIFGIIASIFILNRNKSSNSLGETNKKVSMTPQEEDNIKIFEKDKNTDLDFSLYGIKLGMPFNKAEKTALYSNDFSLTSDKFYKENYKDYGSSLKSLAFAHVWPDEKYLKEKNFIIREQVIGAKINYLGNEIYVRIYEKSNKVNSIYIYPDEFDKYTFKSFINYSEILDSLKTKYGDPIFLSKNSYKKENLESLNALNVEYLWPYKDITILLSPKFIAILNSSWGIERTIKDAINY